MRALFCVLLVAACAADEPSAEHASALNTGPCPSVVCGMNSPEIDRLQFHELSLIGTPNAQGLALEAPNGAPRLYQNGAWYELSVKNAMLSATDGKVVLTDADLIGAKLPVWRGKTQYVLTITRARRTPFFAGAAGEVGAYGFAWSTGTVYDTGPRVELCNGIDSLTAQIAKAGGRDSPYATEELLTLDVLDAVAFEGDRVDATKITMEPRTDDAWFNIGCAGHTLAKLLLTRNTVHTQPRKLPKAWERRQATLKMLSADYCGDGHAFTVSGQALVWQGDAVGFHRAPRELEARWTETGATCVNAPRMLYPTTALGATRFPDIWTQIGQLCKEVPPSCSDLDPLNYDGAYRVSANP